MNTKRFWLGFRSILLGWSIALLALAWPMFVAGTFTGWFALGAVLVFAGAVALEWAGRTKTHGEGNETQARHHAIALVATGVVVGLPLTALCLYGLPGLFATFGAEALATPHTGYTLAIVVALGLSAVLAGAWKYNCAPEWIE